MLNAELENIRVEALKADTIQHLAHCGLIDSELYNKLGNFEPSSLLQERNSPLKNKIKNWLEEIRSLNQFFKKDVKGTRLEQFYEHDARGVSGRMDVWSEAILEVLEYGKNIEDLDYLKNLVVAWPFFWTVAEDILLRIINEKKVDRGAISGVDMVRVKRSIQFLVQMSVSQLEKQPRPFSENNIEEDGKSIHFYYEQDLDQIVDELKEQNLEVEGVTGVWGNLVDNIIINALKGRVEATVVSLSVVVDEDNNRLLVMVKDNGKGMEAKHLDPRNKAYIFKKGSSSTGSTGLGLAFAPERVGSMGGSIGVVSFRNDRSHGSSPGVYALPSNFYGGNYQDFLDDNPIKINTPEGPAEEAATTIFVLSIPLIKRKRMGLSKLP